MLPPAVAFAVMDRQPNKIREQSGTDINAKRTEFVQGSLRMLEDRIAVRPHPVRLSNILIAERAGSFKGTVIAVGPGTYPWIYNKDRSKRRKSRYFQPTELHCGDIVELGGHEHETGYAFPRLNLNGDEIVIASEKDVAAVHCGS